MITTARANLTLNTEYTVTINADQGSDVYLSFDSGSVLSISETASEVDDSGSVNAYFTGNSPHALRLTQDALRPTLTFYVALDTTGYLNILVNGREAEITIT